ncbi:hypothetical protein [Rhizobium metallidurans]|uniref:Uncharacterized protein n=1 Tax=Rhizobium metallidurans TaxID=1265931 RepID=A0A7W6CU37_9HYPH|nr:hypothetical protein [Rhizobium metallidurans]MBB3967183.1 hypothetical protein [Rhizobium metallidurans]
MNKNELEVTIGWLKIRASGLAAVVVVATGGLIVFSVLMRAGVFMSWIR